MTKKILIIAIIIASTNLNDSAWADVKLANPAQKGSLLIFPRVESKTTENATNEFSDTYINITNDAAKPVIVQCYWATTDQFDSQHPIGAGGRQYSQQMGA